MRSVTKVTEGFLDPRSPPSWADFGRNEWFYPLQVTQRRIRREDGFSKIKSHSARDAVWWRDTCWVFLPRGVVYSSPEELNMSHLHICCFLTSWCERFLGSQALCAETSRGSTNIGFGGLAESLTGS